MARSRRRNTRRTTSQRAAGLIALALPAPVQRVADTRVGSLLMLVGVPAMIVFGWLNVTLQDGFPVFTFNRDRAAELQKVAKDHLNNLEQHAASEDWGQSVVGFLHSAQGPNHSHAAPFPSTTPQAPNNLGNWQQQQQLQQQQLRYQQQQQYAAQYDHQAYQRQPQLPYSQPYSSAPTQPGPPYGQFQQQNPAWPSGGVGYQANQGGFPLQPGTATPGSTAPPNGYANGYPAGYPQQQPYNGYPSPPGGIGSQGWSTQSSGQLLRY